jgi:hypothetical protein
VAIKFLRRYENDHRLYEADAGPGRLLLVFPDGYPNTSVSFTEAWSDAAARGTFAYAAGVVGETADTAGRLVAAVLARLAETGAPRGFLWLADPDAWQGDPPGFTAANTPVLGFDQAGAAVVTGLDAPIVSGVRLTVAAGSGLGVDDAGVRISGSVGFVGEHAPSGPAAQAALLHCAQGPLGLLAFDVEARRESLLADACWGFQFACPGPAGSPAPLYEWFALASGNAQDAALRFAAAIDPSDPVNALSHPAEGNAPAATAVRSQLVFTGGGNTSQIALATPLRSRQGAPITLYPRQNAALVFNPGTGAPGPGGAMQLAPAGDFELGCDAGPDPADLLCGLNGTEAITFHPRRSGTTGDVLRFTPYQPAYASRFPFGEVSPVSAPFDPAPALLDDTRTTSWATVVSSRGASVPYLAQPAGAALYGQGDPLSKQNPDILGWKAPAAAIPDHAAFPLAPYAATGMLHAGTFAPGAAGDFEREVIGPTRRRHIPAAGADASGDAYTTVTSSGLLATVKGGTWTQIRLAQTPPLGLYFCSPTPTLQQAFQSGDLMLVAANKEYLGKAFRGEGGCEGADPLFSNHVDIGGWELAANVGTANRYADYRNVLIIKGRRGRLYDPMDVDHSLLANPERWTAPASFAAPADQNQATGLPGNPSAAETIVLAQWLKDYFAAAWKSEDPDLDRFRAVATDESWTGILVLRADIAKVPDDLVGILAGVADPDDFHAHHLGIEITPVSTKPGPIPGPTVSGTSSLFGLIDYTDSLFVPPQPGQPAQAVAPATDQTYDFRLLALKVLFANTAVDSFHSYAQLTATSWFDTPVDFQAEQSTNPYGAIVLEGTLQSDDGQPVYNMSTDTDTTFYFDHDVLAKLEITGAVMSTRDTGLQKDTTETDLLVRSWFGLTGFLDFKTPRVVDESVPGGEYPFDAYSFGSDPAEPDAPRRGLAFSNLGILMTFPPDRPADSSLILDAAETRFDPVTSTARPGSLFRQFALDVAGLRSGTAKTPPSACGYSQVVTGARLTGVDGYDWWGVEYLLPLGTPGNLAGRTVLTARLLTAWAADPGRGLTTREPVDRTSAGGYRAAVALGLPGSEGGAKLIALQNVLKLSVGQIRLLYDTGAGSFLLLFSEIALKLFGLLSIPPGSTLFSLYGDPSGGGDPSGLGWYAMYRKDDGGAA